MDSTWHAYTRPVHLLHSETFTSNKIHLFYWTRFQISTLKHDINPFSVGQRDHTFHSHFLTLVWSTFTSQLRSLILLTIRFDSSTMKSLICVCLFVCVCCLLEFIQIRPSTILILNSIFSLFKVNFFLTIFPMYTITFFLIRNLHTIILTLSPSIPSYNLFIENKPNS